MVELLLYKFIFESMFNLRTNRVSEHFKNINGLPNLNIRTLTSPLSNSFSWGLIRKVPIVKFES